METIFDIRAFGAVGDGVTDDTEAIRAALAEAAKCRGTVIVPPGRYVTAKQTLGKGVRLEGKSAWNFRSFGASEFILREDEADCMIDITGAYGCQIYGMSLNGRRLGANVHGVKLYWEKYNGGGEEDTPTIDDCRIGGFTGDGVHLEHIWCFSVRHSMLCFNKGAGLLIDGWDGFIVDNWFSGNGNAGLRAAPVGSSVTATGNRVEWNRVAGFLCEGGDSWNITGNFFDRTCGPAIRFGTEQRGVSTVSVTGNVFRRSGKPEGMPDTTPYESAQVFLQHCSNLTLTGNTFAVGRDDGGKGTWSPQFGTVMFLCEHCVVSANTWNRGSLTDNFIAEGCTDLAAANNVGEPSGDLNLKG